MKKFKSIAIDGPAGAGKSEVSKILAKSLGFLHVDTGALYRAIAWYMLNNNVDDKRTRNELDKIKIELKFKNTEQLLFLNGVDITDKIRTQQISEAASQISSFGFVRDFLLSTQRNLAEHSNVIMDGRDISTVVLPDADVKIFLTAEVRERALRRMKQLKKNGKNCNFEEILESIRARDKNDSTRKIAPLKPSEDSLIFDTTGLSLDEVSIKLLAHVKDVI